MYTIYADNGNRVSVNCLKCGLELNIDITKLKNTQNNLEGECKCGEPYQYTIEFRKRYRESVKLEGEYFIHGIKEKGRIIIRDLSMIGIRFDCLNPHHISKDDVLRVKFNLFNALFFVCVFRLIANTDSDRSRTAFRFIPNIHSD